MDWTNKEDLAKYNREYYRKQVENDPQLQAEKDFKKFFEYINK